MPAGAPASSKARSRAMTGSPRRPRPISFSTRSAASCGNAPSPAAPGSYSGRNIVMNEFRRLIAGPEPVYAPLVFNPISALLAQAAGFRALYLGGGSMGYIKAGTEANLSLTEMAQAALDIRTVCPLPLILDGAGGWGDPMHVRRAIAASEAAGFAAIEIEDQLLPKRAHHHIGIEHMIASELMVAKIQEAVRARRDPSFLI